MMCCKIGITGPESSGKTTLANSLGVFYKCPIVTEFARDYLNSLTRKYKYHDLLHIAKGQRKLELQIEKKHNLIICDTTLQTIKIWSLEKFNKCDEWLLNQSADYTHYLLCDPNIPWESDPLRENPLDRNRLFNIYIEELKGKKFTIISGNKIERVEQAKKIINSYLNS